MKNRQINKLLFVTGTTWNRHKGTTQPETIQKPADFLPSDPEMTPQGPPSTSASKTLFDYVRLTVRLTFTALRLTHIDQSYELLVNKLRKQSILHKNITAI